MTPVSRRRRLLIQVTAFLASIPALAQEGKSVEWVVGYPAGGGSDVVARTIGEQLSKALQRQVIINNKPGGATNIAATYVANSKDLGSVMFTADFATLAANPSLFVKLPYDAEKDFEPIGLLARFPLLLVVAPNVPATNYTEFVTWAKEQRDGVNYASAGTGSPHHLAGELLREQSGLKLIHVAYRGAAPAVQDLIGGQVSAGVMDTASVQQYVQSGKLKAIGVASPTRLKTLPDVPTLMEQGLKGFEAYAWQGLVVPAKTPADFKAKLSGALPAALESAPVKARFEALGLEAMPGTPDQMASYARSERERWGKLIKANGIKLD